MDYNKENIIKVIKSLERTTWHKSQCARYFGEKRHYIQYFSECTAYAIVLCILQNKTDFDDLVKRLGLDKED